MSYEANYLDETISKNSRFAHTHESFTYVMRFMHVHSESPKPKCHSNFQVKPQMFHSEVTI